MITVNRARPFKRWPWLLIVMLLAAASTARSATFGLAWDNDLFVGTDRFYTNGLRLSGLWDVPCQTSGMAACLAFDNRMSRGFLGQGALRHGLSLSLQQIMITPEDIQRRRPDFDDVPYVGYGNLELGAFSWSSRRLLGYGVRLGTVGPNSGAKQTQKWVHRVTGSERPRGWSNQLGPDVIGGVFAVLAERRALPALKQGRQQQWGTALSVELNNFRTALDAMIYYRIGRQLPGNFVPDYAGAANAVALAGLFDDRAAGWGWESFVGLGLDIEGYSYLARRSDDFDFSAQPGTVMLFAGVGWHGLNVSLTATLQGSTSPLRETNDFFGYGSLAAMWRY